MTTIAKTKENNAKAVALKFVKQTQWVGETTHDTLDKCLVAINLFSGTNSGLYSPIAVRIAGVQGFFMVNQDGSLFYESRVIKVNENTYKIEHLSNDGYNIFENKYFESLEN